MYFLIHIDAKVDDAIFRQSVGKRSNVILNSLVKQSPFASQISHDFEAISDRTEYFLSNDHGCHYVDWTSKVDSLPKTLDLEDLNKLVSSKSLFARKFGERRSGALIARLEDILAG